MKKLRLLIPKIVKNRNIYCACLLINLMPFHQANEKFFIFQFKLTEGEKANNTFFSTDHK